MDETMDECFDKFLKKENFSEKQLNQIRKDIRKCYWKYYSTPEEYFLFDFMNKSHSERKEFLTDRFLWRTLWTTWGGQFVNNESDLLDKYAFCRRLEPFMHRAFVEVKSKQDYQAFWTLANNVKDVFCKPNFNCMGKGIFAAHIDTEDEAKEHFNMMIETGGCWIVEQAIKQCHEMLTWNPSSVNTIRYYSFLDNNGNYSVLPHVIRTGRKGSVVDNGGSGGVFAVIDPETGIVYTDGIDETGKYYSEHPDSGVKYKGWQVPRWLELCEAVEKAHKNYLPKHHYVGWDWALTDQGWTLIEANWGQFLLQFVEKVGRKKAFLKNIGKRD